MKSCKTEHDGICYAVAHGTHCSNTITSIDCTSCTLQQNTFESKQGEQALKAFGGLPALTTALFLLLSHFFPSISSCPYQVIAFLFYFAHRRLHFFQLMMWEK